MTSSIAHPVMTPAPDVPRAIAVQIGATAGSRTTARS